MIKRYGKITCCNANYVARSIATQCYYRFDHSWDGPSQLQGGAPLQGNVEYLCQGQEGATMSSHYPDIGYQGDEFFQYGGYAMAASDQSFQDPSWCMSEDNEWCPDSGATNPSQLILAI